MFLILLLFFSSLICCHENKSKIIGLIPMRNEEIMIEQCLRALSLYADEIIILDDASTDNSLAIIESLAKQCNVTEVISKKTWYRDEPGDRNTLLTAGRAHGGTHFIVIDADEMFTSNCLDDNYLRSKILALSPGDCIAMVWIQLWRSVDKYRFDTSVWTNNYKSLIFCDDGIVQYSSDFIHTSRIPQNLKGKSYYVPGYKHGFMHFQFVNWNNVSVKNAWYKCLEHIRTNKSAQEINSIYGDPNKYEEEGLQDVPANWFANYPFFNRSIFEKDEQWRKKQIKEWIQLYGKDFFNDLNIWYIDFGI